MPEERPLNPTLIVLGRITYLLTYILTFPLWAVVVGMWLYRERSINVVSELFEVLQRGAFWMKALLWITFAGFILSALFISLKPLRRYFPPFFSRE